VITYVNNLFALTWSQAAPFNTPLPLVDVSKIFDDTTADLYASTSRNDLNCVDVGR